MSDQGVINPAGSFLSGYQQAQESARQAMLDHANTLLAASKDELAKMGIHIKQQQADIADARQKAQEAAGKALEDFRNTKLQKESDAKTAALNLKAQQFTARLSQRDQKDIGDMVQHLTSDAGGKWSVGDAYRIALGAHTGTDVEKLTPADIDKFNASQQTAGASQQTAGGAMNLPSLNLPSIMQQAPPQGREAPRSGAAAAPPGVAAQVFVPDPDLIAARQAQGFTTPLDVPSQPPGQQPAQGQQPAPGGIGNIPASIAGRQSPGAIAKLEHDKQVNALIAARTATENDLRDGKVDLQRTRSLMYQATADWLTESKAPRIDAINAEAAYKNWLPGYMERKEQWDETFKTQTRAWDQAFKNREQAMKQGSDGKKEAQDLANQIPDILKLKQQIGAKADDLRAERAKLQSYWGGNRGSGVTPYPVPDPGTPERAKYETNKVYAGGRIAQIDAEMKELQGRVKILDDHVAAVRGAVNQRGYQVLGPKGVVNKGETSALQQGADAAVKGRPGVGQESRGSRSGQPSLTKGLPGTPTAARGPQNPPRPRNSFTVGGKAYTSDQLRGMDPQAARALLQQWQRENPGR